MRPPAPVCPPPRRSLVQRQRLYRPPASRWSMRTVLGMESEVSEGGAKCVAANQRPYALFKVGGQGYCLDNTCTRLSGPVCQCRLQGSVVQFPWHGSRLDGTSGDVVGPAAPQLVRA